MANLRMNTGSPFGPMIPSEEARRLEDESQSETEWLKRVIEIAEGHGWLVDHVFEQRHHARRTSKGFPDIQAVRGLRIIYIELKSHDGVVLPDQIIWLDRLAFASHEVYLARPRDSDAIHQLLIQGDKDIWRPALMRSILWKIVRDVEVKA